MSKYYVYIHIDDNGNVFYIGKGSNDRAFEDSASRRNSAWLNYVESIGYKYKIVIVKRFDVEQQAYEFEKCLQEYYWSIDQGFCCELYSEEWYRKCKEKVWSNPERNKKISDKQIGKEISLQYREKISNSLQGRYVRESNPNKKRVAQLDQSGNTIAIFDTISEAAKFVNGSTSHISKACNGKLKKHKGYKWKYA